MAKIRPEVIERKKNSGIGTIMKYINNSVSINYTFMKIELQVILDLLNNFTKVLFIFSFE